jgi:hypothetical protein
MTSTVNGISTERTSSRVLRPPGGGSSNIFGTADEQTKTSPDVATVEKSAAETGNKASVGDVVNGCNLPSTGDSQNVAQQRQMIANRNRSGAAGFNLLTGEPLGESKTPTSTNDKVSQKQQQSESTESPSSSTPVNVRVRQPPGGTSSKLW